MNRKERRAQGKLARSRPSRSTPSPNTEIARAVLHLRADELDRARDLLKSLLAAEPENAEATHLLGLCYSRMGDVENGLAMLRLATETAPGEALYWNNLASALIDAGAPADAVTAAQRSAALQPGYGHAWENLGLANASLNRHEAALAAFQRLVECEPGDANAWLCCGEAALAAGRAGLAFGAFQSAHAAAPKDAKVLAGMGISLSILERHGEAVEHLLAAAAQEPDRLNTCLYLGRSLLKISKPGEAARWLRRATSIDVKSAMAWQWLADAANANGDVAEADDATLRFQALDPNGSAASRRSWQSATPI